MHVVWSLLFGVLLSSHAQRHRACYAQPAVRCCTILFGLSISLVLHSTTLPVTHICRLGILEQCFSAFQSCISLSRTKHVRLPLHTENVSNLSLCEISYFLRGIDEVFVLLSYCTARVGRCLLVFWAKYICHTFKRPLNLEPIGRPETSANYQHTLRHIPKQRMPHRSLSYKDYSTYSAAVQRK